MQFRMLGLLICVIAHCSTLRADDAKTTEILIIVGPSNHAPGTHEVAAGARLMQHGLLHSNVTGLSVNVSEGWPKKESLLDKADAVVFIGDAFPPNRLPGKEATLAKLGSMMNRGCGIVCVHYATGLHAQDVAKDGEHPLLHWMGGYSGFRCPHHNTIARIFPKAKITPATPGHPISRGWKSFTVHDEPYINNYFGPHDNRLAPGVTALATAMLPPEKPTREIVSWCIQREDHGRGFGIVMPHFFRSWKNDDLRTFILNGITWTARKEVPREGVRARLPGDLSQFKPQALEPKPRRK
ncbi:MAG: ThuA domain-containing protein [Planctomycetes bacterium]|nr:ThuA domain-containing protein [Planctomycetota bacterium]